MFKGVPAGYPAPASFTSAGADGAYHTYLQWVFDAIAPGGTATAAFTVELERPDPPQFIRIMRNRAYVGGVPGGDNWDPDDPENPGGPGDPRVPTDEVSHQRRAPYVATAKSADPPSGAFVKVGGRDRLYAYSAQ